MKPRWTYRCDEGGDAGIGGAAVIDRELVFVADAKGMLHAIELAVGELHEAAALLLVAQELGAHHRRQGQRDHRRHRHSAGQGEAELAEQSDGKYILESDRQLHRNQNQANAITLTK